MPTPLSSLPTPPHRSNRLIPWLWNLGTMTVLSATVCAIMLSLSEHAAPLPATTTVQRGPLEITISEKGETISPNAVEVPCDTPDPSGKPRPLVPEGTTVAKGQTIGQYDVSNLERLCAEQETKLRAATTAVRTAKEEIESQKSKAESDLSKAQLAYELAIMDREKYFDGEYKLELEERQRAVALATRELEDTQERLGHYRNFVKKGFGTMEQLKLKELEVTRAQYALWREQGRLSLLEKYVRKRQQAELTARVEQAKRDLSRTQAAITAAQTKAKEDLATAETNLHQAQCQLHRWQQRLAQPAVTAPAGGTVVFAANSPSTFCKLIDPGQWQVSVKLPAQRAKKLRPGQRAKIQLPNTEARLIGTVRAVAPDTSATRESFFTTTVAIETPPPNVSLKPGLPAEVEVVVDRLPNVLTLPRAAVVARQDQHFALVVGVQGIQLRPIAIGQQTERHLEIRSGLEPGEQVVLDAQERLAGEIGP